MIAGLGRLLAAGFSLWAAALCFGSIYSDWKFLFGYLLAAALLLPSVLIHEGGHALAALAVRWRVIVISAGWLAYHVPNHQLVLSKRVTFHDAGGWVLAVPPEAAVNTLWRSIVISAGGLLASLIQAAACFFAAALTDGPPNDSALRPSLILAALGSIGMAAFCATAFPMKTRGGSDNDAARIAALWRSPEEEIEPRGVTWLFALLELNVRLRDLPEWTVDALRQRAEVDVQFGRAFDTIKIGLMLDAKSVDATQVRALIDRYWREHEPSDWLIACDAWLAAVFERDHERAVAMIAQLGRPSTLPQMDCAARAALAMLDNDKVAANAAIIEMDRVVAAASPYRNPTFRDIRAQIENIVACPAHPSPN